MDAYEPIRCGDKVYKSGKHEERFEYWHDIDPCLKTERWKGTITYFKKGEGFRNHFLTDPKKKSCRMIYVRFV